MDDEYILMNGGTEEDIAQVAHGRGACNYAVNGSYCEICKKGVKNGIRYEKQWSDEFQDEVLVPIEVNEFDEEEK